MSDPKHTVVVGCLVRSPDGRILLVRHPKRGWEIPQGRVEVGEDLVEAAKREVLEESGIVAEPGALAAVCSQLSAPPAVIFLFIAEFRSGTPRPCHECPEVGWHLEKDALALVGHPVNRDRLMLLLSYAGRVQYRSYSTGPFSVIRGDVR